MHGGVLAALLRTAGKDLLDAGVDFRPQAAGAPRKGPVAHTHQGDDLRGVDRRGAQWRQGNVPRHELASARLEGTMLLHERKEKFVADFTVLGSAFAEPPRQAT